MIRRLRSRHRETFIVLGLALPIGLGLALGSRTSVPASAAVNRGDVTVALPSEAPAHDKLLKSGEVELRARVWNAAADGTRVLELTPERDLELPDVLVYWAESGAPDELSMKRVLLGSLAGTQSRRFSLSKDVHGGHLYLYSLARQQLVASLEFDR